MKAPLIFSNPTWPRPSSIGGWTGEGISEETLGGSPVLIGTIHLDIRSAPLLARCLDMLTPGVITVEISRFSVSYRTRHGPSWKERLDSLIERLPGPDRHNPGLGLLLRQIGMPFEWQAARAYGDRNRLRVIPIDSGELAASELPSWGHELLAPENLRQIAASHAGETIDAHIERCRSEAERLLMREESPPASAHPLRWLADPFWERRERLLSRRIRMVMAVRSPLVHIGGWMHLAAGSPWKTLADHLEDLDPVRILIRPPG